MKCEKEAADAAKKRQKEFERQQKREAEEREHALRIAKLDEEIAAEKEATQDRVRAKERADALAQKQRDLENARLRAAKKPTVPRASEASSATNKSSSPTQLATTPKSAHVHLPEPNIDVSEPADATPSTVQSDAEANWQRQKDDEGASNDSIDAIMAMTGLENVKEQVLRIKSKIDIAQRQGISLKDERFNIVLLGNPGTGMSLFLASPYARYNSRSQVKLLSLGTTRTS